MSYIQPKTDFKDGDVLYGIDLNASNAAIKAGVDDNFDKIQALNETKQDILTAGEGIQIENNVITNTQTSAEWGNIQGDITEQSDLQGALGTKQDTLISGTNIKTINNKSILGEGNLAIGGSGGTTDYDELENRPQINSVLLTGNKTLGDLGITVGEVVVGSTPTSDTQLLIDETDFDFQNQDILNTYSTRQDASYSCNFINGVELWNNNSPTSDFASQNVQIDFTGYRYYEIIYYSSTDDKLILTTGRLPIALGLGTNLVMTYNSSSSSYIASRQVNIISTGLNFVNAYYYKYSDGTKGGANNKLIPLKVVGYK